MDKYMQMAIREARRGIHAGDGGPFGAIIVKDGMVVGRGHNQVLKRQNPTLHGEVVAIGQATRRLHTHDLSGCELYTTGEPCPMCLCACLWANIDRVYYGCTIADNARIGFRDERFDTLMGGRQGLVNPTSGAEPYLVPLDRDACLALFDEYLSLNPKAY